MDQQKKKKINTLNESIKACQFFMEFYGVDDPKKYSYYAKRIKNAKRQIESLANG